MLRAMRSSLGENDMMAYLTMMDYGMGSGGLERTRDERRT